MHHLLRRYVWVIDLLGIGIGAALAGHATALLLSSALPARAAAPPRGLHLAAAPACATRDKSIDGIVGRNIFCSTCGDTPAPAPSQPPFRLLAIMFAPPPLDPGGSVAIVRDDEAQTVGPYVVGARLGDATISAIENVRVELDVGHGRREYLELLAAGSHDRADWTDAPASPLAWVRKTGAQSYEVRRSAVDHLGGVTPPWPRAVPEVRDGQAVGVRLFGVRNDSPVAALGLVNGDLLLQANGRSVATPDGALAAYASLKSADHIWLLIDRAGRPIRIDYRIR